MNKHFQLLVVQVTIILATICASMYVTRANEKYMDSLFTEFLIDMYGTQMVIGDEIANFKTRQLKINHWVSPAHVKDKDGKCEIIMCPLNNKNNIGKIHDNYRTSMGDGTNDKGAITNERLNDALHK